MSGESSVQPSTGARLARPGGGPVRVRVADPDESIRDLLVLALGREGWVVRAVRGGEEALRAVGSCRPDAAVLELVLPGIDGVEFEVLRFLMRNPRRVLSKTEILDRVCPCRFAGGINVVELYVSHLRRKVDAGRPPMIHTVRGVGYLLKPASLG